MFSPPEEGLRRCSPSWTPLLQTLPRVRQRTNLLLLTCLQLAVLAAPEPATRGPAEPKVYWTDARSYKVQRADFDGSNIEDLASNLESPQSITVDPWSAKVYWSDRRDQDIRRANLDGSDPEVIVANALNPVGLAVLGPSGKLYYGDTLVSGSGTIKAVGIDGTDVETIINSSYILTPAGIALDHDKLYWCDSTMGDIRRSNHDGTHVEELLTGASGFAGIALDTSEGKMYWALEDEYKIMRGDLDGSNAEEILTSVQPSGGLAVDRIDGYLYWAERRDRQIMRSLLDGSDAEIFVDSLQSPTDIAVMMRETPTTTSSTSTTTTTTTLTISSSKETSATSTSTCKLFFADKRHNKIYRSELDGTDIEVIVSADLGTDIRSPKSLALDGDGNYSRLYWTDSAFGTISRSYLDGTSVEELITGLTAPMGLHVDRQQKKIYVSDGNAILTYNLDGGDETKLIEGLGAPYGLTVDGNNVYWVDYYSDIIQVAKLDGSDVEDLFSTGYQPQDVAVDGSGYIFIAAKEVIQRYDPNSGLVEDIVVGDGLTSVETSASITLDTAAGKVIWSEERGRKIMQSNYDGSDVEQLVGSSTLASSQGVQIGFCRPKPTCVRPDPRVMTKVQELKKKGFTFETCPGR